MSNNKSFLFLIKRRNFYARFKKRKKNKALFVFLYSRYRHNVLYSKRFFLNNSYTLNSRKIDNNLVNIKKNFHIETKYKNKSYFFTMLSGLSLDMVDLKDNYYFNKLFNNYFTSVQLNNNSAAILHHKQFKNFSNWYNFDYFNKSINFLDFFFLQKLNTMSEMESSFYLPEREQPISFLYNNIDLIANPSFKNSSVSFNKNNLTQNYLDITANSIIFSRLKIYLKFFFNNFFYKIFFYLKYVCFFYLKLNTNIDSNKIITARFLLTNVPLSIINKYNTSIFSSRFFSQNFLNYINYKRVYFFSNNLSKNYNFFKTLLLKKTKVKNYFKRSYLRYLLQNLSNFFINVNFYSFKNKLIFSKHISCFFYKDIFKYKLKQFIYFFKKINPKININMYGLKNHKSFTPISIIRGSFFSKRFYLINTFKTQFRILRYLNNAAFFKVSKVFKKLHFKFLRKIVKKVDKQIIKKAVNPILQNYFLKNSFKNFYLNILREVRLLCIRSELSEDDYNYFDVSAGRAFVRKFDIFTIINAVNFDNLIDQNINSVHDLLFNVKKNNMLSFKLFLKEKRIKFINASKKKKKKIVLLEKKNNNFFLNKPFFDVKLKKNYVDNIKDNFFNNCSITNILNNSKSSRFFFTRFSNSKIHLKFFSFHHFLLKEMITKNDEKKNKILKISLKKKKLNIEPSLRLIKKRLLFLKNKKRKYRFDLTSSFNFFNLLLFNNKESKTNVIPVFYFIGTLYNWYYWFYYYTSYMPNLLFKYLCKDNYVSHISLRKHNWFYRNKNNIKYKYSLYLLNFKNKLLYFFMYEFLFFNSIYLKNNILKFYLLKNSNIFFFNNFEYFVVETFYDFDSFLIATDNKCYFRLSSISSIFKRRFFFSNFLNINFYNFFNVNNNFISKIYNDFSFYFINLKSFKKFYNYDKILIKSLNCNKFFFNMKFYLFMFNFFSLNYYHIFVFKKIYLTFLKKISITLPILNNKKNFKYFIILAELNYILINYYLVLLNFTTFLLKYLKN